MKTNTFACLALLLFGSSVASADTFTSVDTFGSDANMFDIDFVTIGDPGNADDVAGNPAPVGNVDYTYRIGQFEISEEMINKANDLGGLGITHDNRGANKPATSITWREAAQFVNWLNIDSGSTEAYKFDVAGNFQLWQPAGDVGFNASNRYRNSQATYFLPSVDEWHKAAYYNANTGTFGEYPTANGLVPTAVASGTAVNTAVYDQLGPADITLAGGLSPYGTVGQGGNVWELEETDFDLVNNSTSSDRGISGGGWSSLSGSLTPLGRFGGNPASASNLIGFRVASVAVVVPEPSTLSLLFLAGLLAVPSRRQKVGSRSLLQ